MLVRDDEDMPDVLPCFDDLEPGTLFTCPRRRFLSQYTVFTKLNIAGHNHHNAMRMEPMCRETERITAFEVVWPVIDESLIQKALTESRKRRGQRRKPRASVPIAIGDAPRVHSPV